MTQNIIITGNRHSQKHSNIMEMDPYNSKTATLLREYDTKNNTSYFKFNEKTCEKYSKREYEIARMTEPVFSILLYTLNKEEIRKIVTLLLKSLEERCMEQMDIRLNVTNSAVDYLAEAGFDAKYGARPLRRAIQSKIEDRLANELLEGKIKRGDQVQVQYRNKEIRFIVKDKKED